MTTRGGCQLDRLPQPKVKSRLKDQIVACLILVSIAGVIVGACVWFFFSELQGIVNEKEPLPRISAPKSANADNFKP